MQLGQTIQKIRKENHLTQEEFAEILKYFMLQDRQSQTGRMKRVIRIC